MPNEERIDSYIDRNAVKQETDFLISELSRLDNAYKNVKASFTGLSSAGNTQQIVQGINATTAANNNLADSQQRLSAAKADYDAIVAKGTATAKEQNIAARNVAQSEKQLQEAIKTSTLAEKNKTAESQKLTTQTRSEQKAVDDLGNEYKQLTLAYNDALNRSRQLNLTAPGSKAALSAALEASAIKEQIRQVDLAAGNTSTSIGRYKEDIIEASTATNGFSRAAGSAWSAIRTLAYVLPGLGIAGIFSLAWDAIKGAVISLGIMGKEITDVEERTKKLNEAYLETESIVKGINSLTSAPSTKIEQLEKESDAIKLGNKSRLEQLNIEKAIIAENAKQAQLKYQAFGGASDGGAGFEFARLSGQLSGAEKRYTDFLKKRATIRDDYDKEELDKAQEQLKISLDIARNEYEKGKEILDNHLKTERDAAAKEIEIATYLAEQRRKIVLNNAKNVADDAIKANDRVLNNEKSSLQERIKAIQSTASARKKLSKAELDDVVNDPSTLNTAARTNAYKNYYKTVKDLAKAELVEEEKLKEAYRRRDVASILSSDKQVLESKKTNEKEFSQSSELSLIERLSQSAKYAEDQQAIAKRQYEVDKDFAIATGKTQKEIFDIEVGYNLKLAQITAETQTNITAILKAEIVKRKKAQDDYFDDLNILSSFVSADASDELLKETAKIALLFKKGAIDYETYQKKLEKINDKYSSRQNQITLDVLKQELKNYNETYGDILDVINNTEEEIKQTRTDAEKAVTDEKRRAALARLEILENELKAEKAAADAIAKIRKQINAIQTDEQGKAIKKTKIELEDYRRLGTEAYESLKTFALASITGRYDRENNEIQDQIDLINKKKDEQIKAEESSADSAQLKADKISAINIAAQSQQEQLELKQRQNSERKAKAERTFAILQIVQNTAVAISKILKDYTFLAGLPLIALATAIGSLQVATILAQPLPRFRGGKPEGNKYQGAAIWGDGGKAEMRERKDGSFEVSPVTPTLTYVDRDDVIHPDAAVFLKNRAIAMTAGFARSNTKKDDANSVDNAGIKRELRAITEAVKSIPQAKFIKTWETLTSEAHVSKHYNDYIDRHVRGR